VRALLDTHVFLWLQAAPGRLAPTVLDMLADPTTQLLVSAATAWEIAIKHALGRLPLPEPAVSYLPSRMAATGASALPVSHEDALGVGFLPPLHRDPFDRLLVSQARGHALVLVTADPAIAQYDVEVLAAS